MIGATDKASATLRKVNDRISGMTRPLRRLKNSFANVSREAGMHRIASAAGDTWRNLKKVGFYAGLAAAGIAAIFKTQFIDTAAQFEKFSVVLETIEGSASKAKSSMDWISDFATTTPYELEQVTEAFVKLRAYGMDPTNGLLRTLGDTSAAMGKDLMQAVEAVADAMTGENERLKEFGIRARAVGNKIVYEYSQNGETIRKAADKNNRAMIQSTLEAIFNQKYSGAMDKLAGTWGGLTSNLGDQWTRFKVMVMDSGAFDYLKDQLAQLLAQINYMADTGKLQEIAEVVGVKIVEALKAAYRFGQQFVAFLRSAREAAEPLVKAVTFLTDTFGTFNTVAGAMAVLIAGKLIAAIVSMGATLVGLGVSMSVAFAVPALIVAAILAIIAAGYLLIKHWDKITAAFNEKMWAIRNAVADVIISIKQWFSDMISDITGKFDDFINGIKNAASKVKNFFTWGDDESASEVSVARGPALNTRGSAGSSTNREQVEVSVDFKNLPQGVSTETKSSGRIPLNTNRGFAMPMTGGSF